MDTTGVLIVAGFAAVIVLLIACLIAETLAEAAYCKAHEGHSGHTVKHEVPGHWQMIAGAKSQFTMVYFPPSSYETWVCDECTDEETVRRRKQR